jgi:predicted permease
VRLIQSMLKRFGLNHESKEQELEEEINAHIAIELNQRLEAGSNQREAELETRRAFGNISLVKEVTREMWGGATLERLAKDLKFGFRVLARNKIFTIVAVLSLALGIGANTAIFSLVDGLWFRPMAVPKSDQIVRIFSTTAQEREGLFSFPDYLDLTKQTSAFNGVVACGRRGVRMPRHDGTLQLLTVNVVSTNFFSVLGVRAAFGRLFTPSDEAAMWQQPVVVLGYRFWKRNFGGNPNVIGTQIELKRDKGSLFTIIGILRKDFREIDTAEDRDVWFPPQSWIRLAGQGDFQDRGFRWFDVLGRLAPNRTVRSARAQVQTIASRLATDWPAADAGRGATVISDLNYRLGQAGTNGLLLMAIVLLVVLVCSVNVANLLLARSAVRGKEIAIRLAVGADRLRLVRQLMTENFVLGMAGLAAGLLIGLGIIAMLPSLVIQPPGFEPLLQFQFDERVFVFSLGVSIVTIFLFGLAPSLRSSHVDLVPALKDETSLSMGSPQRGLRLRHWLVIAQVSISTTLLIATGVLVHSYLNTRLEDIGIGRHNLLLAYISWSGDQGPVLYRQAIQRIRDLPGVQEVGFATRAPLSLSGEGMVQRVYFPERLNLRNEAPIEIDYNSISSNFLTVMGTALLRGRQFTEVDQAKGAPVALINARMAQVFWPGEDPINKSFRLGGPSGPEYHIVGVVQNTPINSIGEAPKPYLYLPYWRNFTQEFTMMVRTKQDPLSLHDMVRHTLISIDPRLDPLIITTENQLIRYSAARYQITAELVSALGILGLILTAVGLYGVISYGVVQRRREIGLRMALGADRPEILTLVFKEVIILGGIGMLLGLPMSIAGTHLASALLYDVSPWDISTFIGSTCLLSAVLLLAGFIPARRATRIEPMLALRT